ncbi:hypothetical protein [Croceicoccus hydrothermalis]|uniref:hypothetical protein n=1 Tax=Croceicoccus hydrothermalis TaxID=2867964 RepID=UPI001EFA966B|nr:hypothetical protein [Croceicoccus hydrothermalis]
MPTVWLIVVIGGPLLLLLALLYSRTKNRKNETAAQEHRADAGAAALREDIEHDREIREEDR